MKTDSLRAQAGALLGRVLGLIIAAVAAFDLANAASPTLNIGSKRFTESYILGEILAETALRAGEVHALHKAGLGNTGIVFAALRSGAIDLYPEYSGTIAHELLAMPALNTLEALNRELKALGLVAFAPLGFNNSYALAMREEEAQRRDIRTISDIVAHPDLRYGLSQEFMQRKDGWPALRSGYGLEAKPRGVDHGLAYEALAAGQIDVIDMYSTDAKQIRYRLRVLRDDRAIFPAYRALVLARSDLEQRAPRTWRAIEALAGSLDEAKMTALNAEAELAGRRFRAIALSFLDSGGGDSAERRIAGTGLWAALIAPDLARLSFEHLYLVMVSLACAVAVGIPLGILADRSAGLRRAILPAVAVVQTIPALALLAFLITLMSSIGTGPALVALFLYSLLPIVRNTVSGLQDISPQLRESALALGFSARSQLLLIELPLAARSILSGIKTSAVWNVGTATIAAFIGAGGYGERIASGLALNDNALLLAGAVPAAAMALVVQGVFDLAERAIVSRGLRLHTDRSRAG